PSGRPGPRGGAAIHRSHRDEHDTVTPRRRGRPMTTLAFLGSLALSALVFELLSGLWGRPAGGDRLSVHLAGEPGLGPPRDLRSRGVPLAARVSTWQALLIALWPRRFHPQQARTLPDVL